MIERETGRDIGRGRSRLHAPDVGFDSGSPGSRPGPKAGTKPLRHPGIPSFSFFNIYLFMRDRERERERERGRDTGRGRSRLHAPGARRGIRSRVSRIAPWAKGRRQTAAPPRDPKPGEFLKRKPYLGASHARFQVVLQSCGHQDSVVLAQKHT